MDVPTVVVEFRVMPLRLRENVRPVGTVSAKLTVPAKPLMLATVIVEFASLPASTLALVGLSPMLKSTPSTVTVVEAENGGVVVDVPVKVIAELPACVPA